MKLVWENCLSHRSSRRSWIMIILEDAKEIKDNKSKMHNVIQETAASVKFTALWFGGSAGR